MHGETSTMKRKCGANWQKTVPEEKPAAMAPAKTAVANKTHSFLRPNMRPPA
jgi:hypothetical protein